MSVRLSVRFAVLLGLLALTAAGAAAKERVVNVYNWSAYIAPDTLARFTKATGIKVRYDTYGDNETLDAKLMTGDSGYDVVFPSSSPFFAQQVKAGIYRKLDYARIPNAKGLDKRVMARLAKVDPSNAHGVPYMMAATGIGYNVAEVKKLLPDAPVNSWAMLFDPKVVSVLKKCGVTLLDTPLEVVPAMLDYLGRDPEEQDDAALKAAMDALTPLRHDYRYLNSEKYRDDLVSGDICVAQGYVGDLVQVRRRAEEAGDKRKIAIVIPKQGAVVNIDVMAIPKDAPHPRAAEEFINFILRPDVIGDITNAVGYANAVPASLKYVKPSIKDDPVIYPPPAVEKRLFSALPPASFAFERKRTRAWTRFRAGLR